MHLLDVNVLIARADSSHPHHAAAAAWMAKHASSGWATCPITENGMLRILGQPSYPGGPGSPEAALVTFRSILAIPGHRFLPDDISLATSLGSLQGISPAQLADVYLLALAIHHGVSFLSLDRRMNLALVPGGKSAYVQLPV
jgi:toxin-antitoxin system PIN domain toxin